MRPGPAALALGLLAVLAARHPGLRFVDAVGFSVRAEHLAERLADPLYPVGYPALLALGHALGGDVLVVGKALSVLAGAAAVLAATVLTGPAAALWLLAQAGVLEWGATEGTDVPAAALSLGALTAAHTKRPWLAGALAGMACGIRWTSLAVVPVVAIADRRALLPFAALALPNLVVAGLPDQGQNLFIGAGGPTRLLSWDTLLRLPGGFGRAVLDAVPDWPLRVSALGLLAGARDPRARRLLAWALLHCLLVGLAFSNPRLCLPAQLAFALGATWLVPRGLWIGALALAAWNLPSQATPSPREEGLRALGELRLESPVLTNSAWFHTHEGRWLRKGIQLNGLGDPRGLTPERLAERMRETGAKAVALEIVRVPNAMPGLVPMLKGVPEGFVLVEGTPAWRVFTRAAPPPGTTP